MIPPTIFKQREKAMIEVTGNKFKLGEPVGIEPIRKVGQVVGIVVHKSGSNNNYVVQWATNELTLTEGYFAEEDLLDLKKKPEPVEAPAAESPTQDGEQAANANPQPEQAAQ